MRIARVFNNNSVAVMLPDGREAVLVGPGVGFDRRRGDEVDESQVEKRFVLEATGVSEGTVSILTSLPYAVVGLTSQIAARLDERHGLRLSPAVEIGLADHLAAALARLDGGTSLFNNLLFETKASYRSEFQIALEVLDWVEELAGRRLPLDEAGFITLHLVNAGLSGDMAETQRTATAVQGVLGIVRAWMPPDSALVAAHLDRFLTHLKVVIRRITEDAQFVGGHESLIEMLRATEPDAFSCAESIAAYLQEAFGAELSREEVLYLVIHVARLRHAVSPGAEDAARSI